MSSSRRFERVNVGFWFQRTRVKGGEGERNNNEVWLAVCPLNSLSLFLCSSLCKRTHLYSVVRLIRLNIHAWRSREIFEQGRWILWQNIIFDSLQTCVATCLRLDTMLCWENRFYSTRGEHNEFSLLGKLLGLYVKLMEQWCSKWINKEEVISIIAIRI